MCVWRSTDNKSSSQLTGGRCAGSLSDCCGDSGDGWADDGRSQTEREAADGGRFQSTAARGLWGSQPTYWDGKHFHQHFGRTCGASGVVTVRRGRSVCKSVWLREFKRLVVNELHFWFNSVFSSLQLTPVGLTSDLLLYVSLVSVTLLLIFILTAVGLGMALTRRATHGTYSPSRQEKDGSRVEMWSITQPPPTERLIWTVESVDSEGGHHFTYIYLHTFWIIAKKRAIFRIKWNIFRSTEKNVRGFVFVINMFLLRRRRGVVVREQHSG